MNSLIDKYNIPGPRYTSYPTVPYWDNDGFTSEQWQKTVIQFMPLTATKPQNLAIPNDRIIVLPPTPQ